MRRSLALSGGERAAFLRQVCAEDESLCREVESLLAQTSAADRFLNRPAMEEAAILMEDPRGSLIGRHVGVYRIDAWLGAGGMGEVYRARDTKLGRDVAIKILPAMVRADRARLARFEREARLLAALNHPRIGAIYGFEETTEISALVLELVDGPTLADVLTSPREPKGAGSRTGFGLPVRRALAFAGEIAEALEAAHAKGIIHRDLKPANIKVTGDDQIKVLDFGLAKAAIAVPGREDGSAGTLPTITVGATDEGTILGTVAYMSPEQARGKDVDERTDIWAFGCVLFEMISGTPPYAGDTTSDTLAAVLEREPDWGRLPADCPEAVLRLLRRCLRKEASRRLQHIGDARLEIDDVMAPPPGETAETARPPVARQLRHRGWLAAAAVVTAAGAAAGTTLSFRYWASTPAASEATGVVRTLIGAAPADALTPLPTRPALILSPDGKRLVFSAINGDSQQLYMRWLDRLEATPIPGTENSNSPFFSPDGEWIGFWSGVLSPGAVGVLKKVPLSGGPAEPLCKTGPLFGASWGSDGRIVFANVTGGLLRVSAAVGGEPEPFTTLDLEAGEVSHRLPHVWPDGEGLFFTVLKRLGQFDEAIVVALSLATSERRVVVSEGADARYVLTGHVLFVRGGTLIAAPFDPARLEVTGPPRAVLDGVMHAVNTGMTTLTDTGVAQFSVSRSGALLYVPGGIFSGVQRTLFWRDRNGAATPVATPPIAGTGPRFSPDEQRLLIHAPERAAGRASIYDLRRGVLTPLAAGGGWPIWTPDGTHVTVGITEPYGIGLVPPEGVALERLTVGSSDQYPGSWSPDGQLLAFVKGSSTGGWEIWIHSRAGERRLRPSGSVPAVERYPAFSPDGRWLAYVTNESGRDEVWVKPSSGSAEQHKVSTRGGSEPAWARNGRELFYTVPVDPDRPNPSRMMAVDVSPDASFTAGTPRMLFEAPYTASSPFRGYDVTRNGERFVMSQRVDPPAGAALTHMILVQNWTEELKRLVSTR